MRKYRISPVHPGVYLKELLDELGLSQHNLARQIGVTPMRISHLVNGARPVTAELALRLGRYFSQDPRYWLNLQNRYDMDIAEDELGKRVAREVRPFKNVA
jgi:addiction module HigA family antidote